VIARRALDGSGRVVVEDERTGTRYDVTPFQPLYMDEWDGRQPALPIDKARKAAAALPLPGDVYAPTAAPAADGTVVRGRFGPRSQPAAELPDPLDADRWATMEQAMAAFFSVFGVSVELPPDIRAMIKARISEAGLDKAFVRDLALSLSPAIRTTGAYR
jgi:hypothetical protein